MCGFICSFVLFVCFDLFCFVIVLSFLKFIFSDEVFLLISYVFVCGCKVWRGALLLCDFLIHNEERQVVLL